MKKNLGSQLIAAQLVSAADGSNVTTGTTTVAVEVDGTAGTGGTATHIANGKWEYAPIQADTNGDHLTFQFTNASAITVLLNVYTTDAGASLTAIPWNASWDAEVQSECADALTAYDPPTNTEMLAAHTTTDALITSSHSTTDGLVTTADAVADLILTDTTAIVAKTNSLTFTGTEIHADVQSINGAEVTGNGNAEPWDGA